MERFRTGNIIKSPNGWVVVFNKYYTSVDGKRMFSWISFDSENSIGSSPVVSYSTKVSCECSFDNWIDEDTVGPSFDCKRCAGTGERLETKLGEENYELLATNGKAYLKKLLNGALNQLV